MNKKTTWGPNDSMVICARSSPCPIIMPLPVLWVSLLACLSSSLLSRCLGIGVSSGHQSTHCPPCKQLLAVVGVGASCQVPSSSYPCRCAPLVVVWGCCGSCPVHHPVCPPVIIIVIITCHIVIPLSSIILSSCPGPCHPAIIVISVLVSLSPPHHPHHLPS